jgi:hypothetical protein
MVYLKQTISYKIMQRYSENQIRILHSEFRSHKKYAGKLAFFDNLFGIIPFSFPEFDPKLAYFFQKEKTEELIVIFRNERNNPGLTEKKFSFKETFVFNIKPANSNSSIYSNYILRSFISRAPVFEEWIQQYIRAGKTPEFYLDEANGVINSIEYILQNEQDKSFRVQCMSIFYKGFSDAFKRRVNLPDKKRKFIELYLYAQGIIYLNYIHSLKAAINKTHNPAELNRPQQLDLSGKLELMNELGMIDFLKSKFSGLNAVTIENEIAKIISLITGEYIEQKDLSFPFMLNGHSIT